MHSFLLVSNVDNNLSGMVLDKAGRIIKKIMSSIGVPVTTNYVVIPEIKGGWFCSAPSIESKNNLFSVYSNDDYTVLFYGELFESSHNNNASYIEKVFRSKGIDAVRNLEGCFSSAIIDLKNHKIFLACDILGQRALRYYTNRDSFFVSSHDICIMAAGACEADLNIESAASILSFDWSLSGESLIKGIRSCHPNEYMVWSNSQLEQIKKPLLDLTQRFDARDSTSYNNHIDLIIEKMQSYVRNACDGTSVVDVDLTAGIDSRAIFGIILSVLDASQIRIHTAGADQSLDVRVARQIARSYSIIASNFMPNAPKISSFSDYCSLLALTMNGDTNSKRAVSDFPKICPDDPPHFKGLGGEIYRGHYYPTSRGRLATSSRLATLSLPEVISALTDKFPRIYRLPWQSEDMAESMERKLQTIVYAYSDMSKAGSDLLDLFYLYERLGRWGALDMRQTWAEKRISPFNHPGVVKLAFQLPAPLGSSCDLHKAIIKRFLPEIYHLPINRKDFLFLLSNSRLRRLGRFIIHGAEYIYRRKIETKFMRDESISHEQLRGSYFANEIYDSTYDLMTRRGSVSMELFGKQGTEKILTNFLTNNLNYLEVIGSLRTIEHMKDLADQVQILAKK